MTYYGGGIPVTSLNWGFQVGKCCDQLMFYNKDYCCERYHENLGSCEDRATAARMVMTCGSYLQIGMGCLVEMRKERQEEEAQKEKAQEEKAQKEKAEIDALFADQLRDNPNDAKVYEERGFTFLTHALGENKAFLDQAIADFSKAIKLDPQAASAYSIRAIAYSQQNDFDRAIADYDSAIRIEPDNAEHYAWRGSSYIQKKNFDQALADLNNAIRLNPQHSQTYNFRGVMYFAESAQYKENGDFDKAVEDIDQAVKDMEESLRLDPDNVASASTINNIRKEKEIVYRLRRERQEKYDRLVQKMKSASTEEEYEDLCEQLRSMNGYKNTIELANECENQYQPLKERREAEEQEQRKKQKKKTVMGVFLHMGLVVAYICFFCGTDVVSDLWDYIGGGPLAYLIACILFGIFSLAMGIVTHFFQKNSDGGFTFFILLMLGMILVQSITICVWQGNVGFLFIYLIGRAIVTILSAIPGVIVAYKANPGY